MGHDGSLSTGHGNSPKDMLIRLETMYAMGMDIPLNAIRRQIAAGIDILVHLGRMRDRTRKVLEIVEVDGFDTGTGEIKTHSLFTFRETGEKRDPERVEGKLVRCGDLRARTKLKRAGYEDEDGEIHSSPAGGGGMEEKPVCGPET